MTDLDTLTRLPLAERLAAMESLWDSLCRDGAADLSPDWHQSILESRLAERENGQHRDWETVKRELQSLTQS
ncbi:MAG: addiction module protein [Thiobacillus sp.]|nr:addiction module protein [Thiobacillus sp.]